MLLLRTDGRVDAFGGYICHHHPLPWVDWRDPVKIPRLPEGMRYTFISAAARSTLLLRSDGNAFYDGFMDFEIPPLPRGVRLLNP